ncbi:MAG: PAS domain S-box protein, partial [Alphaproteobacteria bacterium]
MTSPIASPSVAVLVGAFLLVLIALVWDIRSRRRMRKRLIELNHEMERHRVLAEIGSDWIWETDRDHRFTYLSDRFSKLCGMSRKSVIGRTRIELAQGDIAVEPWKSHAEALEQRAPFRDLSYSFPHPSGRIEWFRVSGQPVHDPAGHFTGYQGTSAR